MSGPTRVLLATPRKRNDEMIELVSSLGSEITSTLVLKRPDPNPRTFFGTGQIEMLAQAVSEAKPDRVLVNADLTPAQLYTIEKTLGVEVMDRIRLILEIFQERAHSREAALQVELARLRYEAPLIREWVHMAKSGERPGFLAGGEYQVSQYYDLIKKRTTKIESDIRQLRAEREMRRKGRSRKGVFQISLGGYTNSGKSTLLRRMTGADVAIENRLFSTLATTTRRAEGRRWPVLVTDTVGFFQDLPAWLIEAFASTLEEIFHSDLVLLVVDASEDRSEILRKTRSSLQTLTSGGGVPAVMLVWNKCDRLEPAAQLDLLEWSRTNPDWLAAWERAGMHTPAGAAVSAHTGAGIEALTAAMLDSLPNACRYSAYLPWEAFAPLEHWLWENAIVTDVAEPAEGPGRIRFRMHRELAGALRARLKEKGGRLEEETPPEPEKAPPAL